MKLRRNEMKLRKNEMKLRRNFLTPTWKMKNIQVDIVLFLKKVHSWEGITEMVLGSFLLVL